MHATSSAVTASPIYGVKVVNDWNRIPSQLILDTSGVMLTIWVPIFLLIGRLCNKRNDAETCSKNSNKAWFDRQKAFGKNIGEQREAL